jgi:tryptophan halogenase
VKAHGYHFDANLVGKYFKKISLASGVTCIDAKVHDVVLKENGFIKSLKLDIDQEITGDLFIDASGFSKILNKKLDSKWISYSKNLPVNSAMPFILPYSKGEEISPVTIARAQKNGWMWKIPTSSRYGSGYVFCDDFVTPEQAQRDIEEDLGHDIDPIRILKFDTGRLEKCWTKNCVSIGLSSAFAEPLEATSIHSTIVMLYWLVFDFLKDTVEETCNSGNEYLFNDRCNTMFDSFRDFLIAHYQGGRNDSEFWKYISSGATLNDRVKSILEVSKIRCMSSRDFHNFWGSSGWGLWSFVLAGTHNLTAKVGKKELKFYNMEQSALEKFNETEEHLKQNFSELLDNTKFINIINRKHQEYLKNL